MDITKFLVLFIAFLASVRGIIYKDNKDGETATFHPLPIQGNYESNNPSKNTAEFDLRLKLLIDINVETGYRLIDRAYFEFIAISNVDGDSVGVSCNGIPSSAERVPGTSRFLAEVASGVRLQGEDNAAKWFNCTWTDTVTVANGNGMSGAAPKLVIYNRPIQYTPKPEWYRSGTLYNVGPDDITVNWEALQVGNCVSPDTILYIGHANPAQMTVVTAFLEEIDLQQSTGRFGKVCAIAPSMLGSGRTLPVFDADDQCIELYNNSNCNGGLLASINKIEAKQCTNVDGYAGSVQYDPNTGFVTAWPVPDCDGAFNQLLDNTQCLANGARLNECFANKSLTRGVLFAHIAGFVESFYEDVIRPMRAVQTKIDYYGFEYHSRWKDLLPLRYPGEFRHTGCSTCFVNPAGAHSSASITECSYQPDPTLPQIFSQKLYDRALAIGRSAADALKIATFSCDPSVPSNLPTLLGADGLNDEALCLPPSIHRCTGTASPTSSLGSYIDTFDLGDPSLHTTYDFIQMFFGDDQAFNALSFLGNNGTVGAFVFRAANKFGPFGFGTAQGYNAAFTLRNLRPEEIEHMNAPHIFPGFATDQNAVIAAALSSAPGTIGNGIMPQPHLAQVVATTTIDSRDTHPTIYGVPPSALEVPLARQLYNEARNALLSGATQNAITGSLVLLQGDHTFGALGGSKFALDINNSPRFAWQYGNDNIEDFRATGHVVRSIGQTGYHIGGLTDQPDLLAEAVLEQSIA